MEDYKIVVDGVLTSYVHYRWESSKFFVFLHGRWRSKEDWNWYFDELKEKKIWFLAIDFPWFWKSSMPNETRWVAEYSDFVIKLLDKLDICSPVSLVAHSFGGRVASYLAVNYKDRIRDLFLIAPGWVEKEQTKFRKSLLNIGKKILSPNVMKPVRNQIKKIVRSQDYLQSNNMEWIFLKVVNQDLRHVFKYIDQNVFLYWWDSDDQILRRQIDCMRDSIKSLKFHEYANVWHDVHIYQKDDILADMINDDTN